MPLRQHEDLEPSMAEHRGEEAGAGNVIVGRGAERHREESPRAGAGPGANHLVDCREDLYAGYSLGISGNLSILR